jgi:hypothetical protein
MPTFWACRDVVSIKLTTINKGIFFCITHILLNKIGYSILFTHAKLKNI